MNRNHRCYNQLSVYLPTQNLRSRQCHLWRALSVPIRRLLHWTVHDHLHSHTSLERRRIAGPGASNRLRCRARFAGLYAVLFQSFAAVAEYAIVGQFVCMRLAGAFDQIPTNAGDLYAARSATDAFHDVFGSV